MPALSPLVWRHDADAEGRSGLDNAGKTTIVKKIMGEDVNTVSPTLGFIIKTIDYDGCAHRLSACPRNPFAGSSDSLPPRYKLNICKLGAARCRGLGISRLNGGMQGTSAARRRCARTGAITLRRRTL